MLILLICNLLTTAGLVASAFGPSNTFLLLHLLYGEKYSATEAPLALAIYCPYILLLATNGILESFVQAVSRGAELKYGHFALISITGVQTALTVGLVLSHGTLGMILADGLGMVLRISYCAWFVQMYAKRSGINRVSIAREASPKLSSLAVLLLAGIASALSLGSQFGRGWFAALAFRAEPSFWRAANVHVFIEASLLAACVAVIFRTEQSLLVSLSRSARTKKD